MCFLKVKNSFLRVICMYGKGIMYFVFCFLRMINFKKKMYLIIVIMLNYYFFFEIKIIGFNMSNYKVDLRDID